MWYGLRTYGCEYLAHRFLILPYLDGQILGMESPTVVTYEEREREGDPCALA